jgi:hypothetical protein
MGAASTHRQHLVRTELPPSALEGWLAEIGHPEARVSLRPSMPWSDRMDLTAWDRDDERELLRLTSTVVDGGSDGPALLLLDSAVVPDAPDGPPALAALYLLARSGAARIHDLRPAPGTENLPRQLAATGIVGPASGGPAGRPGFLDVDRARVEVLAADDATGRAGRQAAALTPGSVAG